MNKIVIVLVFIVSPVWLLAQQWSVNSSDYQFSMSVTGKMQSDVDIQNCILGAFVGDECRGVADVTETSSGDYYYFLTVYSNSVSDEEIAFKLEDSESTITELVEQIEFLPDAIYGNPDNPFVWHTNSVYASTDFVFFSCENQQGATIIDYDKHTIKLDVSSVADVTKLIANFVVAPGVDVLCGDEEQKSGVSTNDFTNSVVYRVVNGDESSEWTVTVNVMVGIADVESVDVTVFPNPVTNLLKVSVPYMMRNDFTVVITDISGKVVEESHLSEINVSHFPQGVYIVSISCGSRIYTSQIIKM